MIIKPYNFKLKITKFIKEVYLGQEKEFFENGILLIRYLAEEEYRSLMLEIREIVLNKNLEKIPYSCD